MSYILPRGEPEKERQDFSQLVVTVTRITNVICRLGLQHRYLLECVYENRLLPTALELTSSARILDSGTGSGELG